MRAKIKKVESHFPPWVQVGEEYYCEPDGSVGWYKVSEGEKDIIINESYLEVVEGKIPDETAISVPESKLQDLRNAVFLAKEYCEEVKLNHESKMGNNSWRRSDEVLYQGLRQDLEFLGDVVECFEDIWPEDYL